MTLIYTDGSFGKKRVVWLVCLLLVLAAVSGLVFTKQEVKSVSQPVTSVKVKGVWLNYTEFADMIDGCSCEQYESNIEVLLDNLQQTGLNTLFVHVRSHSDSFYPSSVFPWSEHINGGAGVDYDPLAILVQKAHDKKIRVHAWLNPYRIFSGTLAELPSEHPALKVRQEEEHSVVETDTGVYYNPASVKARTLVLSGVEELLKNYDLDGIQYDDYFYPTTESSFDQGVYQQYCDTSDYPLSLAEWRRTQVNLLIAATYRKVKEYEDVVFGVSPAAGIRKNYEELYADVEAWVQGNYVDYICPQLYFGFSYPDESFRFDALFSGWEKLAGDTPLYIGLASYKVGQEDAGSTEWVTSTDLLAKQTGWVHNAGGVCFYHYSSLFKNDGQSLAQRERVAKALNEF